MYVDQALLPEFVALQVDAKFVHVREPELGEVAQPPLPVGDHVGLHRYTAERSAVGRQLVVPECFFQGDEFHVTVPSVLADASLGFA